MTFLVDSNVIVYSAVPSEYREHCLELLAAIARGDADGRTSTAVLEEVWHLKLSGRAGNLEGLTARAHAVLGPLLPVSDESFRRALTLHAPTNQHARSSWACEAGRNDLAVVVVHRPIRVRRYATDRY